MMIWLEIWSFVSNFNFDNSFWFWKYPQVTKYSFEICNFSYNLINVLKIDQTIYFLFCVITIENLNISTFEHPKFNQHLLTLDHWNIGTLEHWNIGTFGHWNIETLKHWNIVGTFEHSTFNQHLVILEHWNTGTLKHWKIRTLEHWNMGTLEQWGIGTLEH